MLLTSINHTLNFSGKSKWSLCNKILICQSLGKGQLRVKSDMLLLLPVGAF